MDTINSKIIQDYQVRKTYDDKTKFINFLQSQLKLYDYELKVDENGKNRNLIVGDVKEANIILSAHYDTPPNSIIPIITFISNIPMYIFSQFLTFIPWVIVYFMFTYLIDILRQMYNHIALVNTILKVMLLGINVLPILILLQMTFGKANKHTLNDNTSGVTTLIEIMSKMNESDRSKVAFVFFDQEEAGLIGSSLFHQKYKNVMRNKPLINFDCVSNGTHFLFVCKRAFTSHEYYSLLSSNVSSLSKSAILCKASKVPYMSDQLHFKYGVGVVSVKSNRLFGYYLNRIHSRHDTIYEIENIVELSNLFTNIIANIE